MGVHTITGAIAPFRLSEPRCPEAIILPVYFGINYI